MTDYRRPPSHDCPPAPVDPAPQPKPPGNGSTCQPIPPSTPPTLEPPAKCPPDPDCKCPPKPGSDPNCLENLIAKQANDIAIAEKAAKFKELLEGILKLAKTASTKYTRTAYDDLIKQWVEQDAIIADLIRQLVCHVPCWRCVIECYICPLLNELRYAEQWLYDDGKLYADVHDLYDLQYWHTRDKQAKERRYLRIQNVLTAWTKDPLNDAIAKILKANKADTDAVRNSMGTEPGKAVYDLFLKVIPRHLAIAPPAGSAWTTKIDKVYTEFCDCDKPDPDDCCGPDVGLTRWSLRQRLIGPQPYLIDPNDYFAVICCLVEKRYSPAKDALAKAEADLQTVTNQITRFTAQLDNGIKNFESDAKGVLPGAIDCCDFEPADSGSQSPQAR